MLPVFIAAWGVALPASSAAEPWRRFDYSGPGMGTVFRLSVAAAVEQESAVQEAVAAAFERLAALNAVYSDYEPNSEINRLAAAAPQPWAAGPDLWRLTARALELAAATEGAFDPACGRLTRLWRSTRQRGKLPAPERLRTELAGSGWRGVELRTEEGLIQLRTPGLLLDFGGIAKGFAADEMLRLLRGRGFESALVQAGGDTAAGAPPPGEAGWRVTLRTGLEETEPEPVKIELAGQAVSTSGDLHQHIDIEGRRYSHIIDPRTGLGLTRRIACSVIAQDAATSDALATALCVLGPEQGREVARRAGVSARWVWLDECGARHVAWVRTGRQAPSPPD